MKWQINIHTHTRTESMGRCARRTKTKDVISLFSYMAYHTSRGTATTVQMYVDRRTT